MQARLDPVLRNGRPATACETLHADFDVPGRRVIQRGCHLPHRLKEIDAAGRVVTTAATARAACAARHRATRTSNR
jgi:hypothetical protein